MWVRPVDPVRVLVQWFAVLALLSGAAGAGHAQLPATIAASDTLQEVRLVDGSTLFGRIVATDNGRISLETNAGVRLDLQRGQILSIRAAEGRMVGGQFWRDDPNKTRLFFAPTGRSLRAGEGYFGVYELFIPFVSYGITDQFTMSGGSPFYLGMFNTAPPVYIAPKLQLVSSPGTEVSVGALAIYVPGNWDWDGDRSQSMGVVYGVGTFGGNDNAASAGIGWGFFNGDFSSRPVIMLGGEARTGRSTKLVTENWFVPGEDGIVLSGGMRFFGERLSADVGLIGFASSDETGCCFPLVNFVYNFGGRR